MELFWKIAISIMFPPFALVYIGQWIYRNYWQTEETGDDYTEVEEAEETTDDDGTLKYLVFDTETSGLSPEKNEILQLSYQVRSGATHKIYKQRNFYFPYPDESRVSPKAIEVNGLTKTFLDSVQTSDRAMALKEFFQDIENSDVLVAHNGTFDAKMINGTMDRLGLEYDQSWTYKIFDTMKSTVEMCALPRRGGGYKYPKLSELAICLDVPYKDLNLHDSMSDVELTSRCFVKLNQICEQNNS